MTAAAGGGLDQEGKAQTLGMRAGIGDGLDRPTAPGSDGNLGLLRETFRSDLVAQAAHHIAARPDENDSHLAAKIGECRMFRHKAPAHPNRICTRGRERLFQPAVVEVAALGPMSIGVDELGGTERNGLVCFADEHGMTVGLGEKSDGAQRHAVLLTELARRMDESHRGFAAIDNRNSLEFIWHKGPDETIVTSSSRTRYATRTASPDMMACRIFRCSVSTPSGSATVW